MSRLSVSDLEALAMRALVAAGASADAAVSTARGLVYADAQGTASHGVSRVPQYAGHLRVGRIDGRAIPRIVHAKGAIAIVDAADGLAFPACDLALAHAIETARSQGVAFVAVRNSYHFGAAIYHLEAAAGAGMVGLALSNSPAAIAAAGGARPLFGTNPIAAIFPRSEGDPLAIDLALSEVARGKLMVAAKAGQPIPLGWALDEHGQPTTDAARGLKGSMAALGAGTGSAKGVMLALVVELLVTALAGARFGFEADSFFDVEGNRPRIGQAFLVLDPLAFGERSSYLERVETLVRAMLDGPAVRLPGSRRYALAREASVQGIEVPDALLAQLRTLARASGPD
jgi:(2R)-3-sulfolactate dehydrogenase (NADP+)